MLRDDLQLIRKRLEAAENIAIFAHLMPDGDSVGSVLALGWALEDAGKKVQYIAQDPIPERYQFLFQFIPGGKNPFIPEPVGADCYVTPDISSADRAGAFFQEHPEIPVDICIDHHVSNQGVGKLNWIVPESPAACEVLNAILPELGLSFSKRISSALLCGIITDTNSFSNSNVCASSLRAAADLIDKGADIFYINHLAYKEHTIQEMDFWRIGMTNMKIDDGLAWSVITKSEREAMGIITTDDPGFVNYMGNTSGVKVSVLFIELDELTTKISWRSLPGYNVAEVAVCFDGGGHKAASGATVRGKRMADLILAVLARTKEMITRSSEQK